MPGKGLTLGSTQQTSGKTRRRKRPNMKLIRAALRVWELKQRDKGNW